MQIKRIHEYKRQLLNILQTIALYNAMRAQPTQDWVPRVKIFAGKAAASYHRAKLIIKLIHDVGRVINNDPALHGLLKVVFLPDYNVSLAEAIIPAADLSEQISTAGMEASGTGNMKLALNGALTIGTLDGANVEIRDRVGDDNMFIFGLTAEEVDERRRAPRAPVEPSHALQQVLDAIGSGVFSPEEPQRYRELVADLTGNDWFMVAADFEAYSDAQARGRGALAGLRRMVAVERAEHRECRLVLFRPQHPGIRTGDLECPCSGGVAPRKFSLPLWRERSCDPSPNPPDGGRGSIQLCVGVPLLRLL